MDDPIKPKVLCEVPGRRHGCFALLRASEILRLGSYRKSGNADTGGYIAWAGQNPTSGPVTTTKLGSEVAVEDLIRPLLEKEGFQDAGFGSAFALGDIRSRVPTTNFFPVEQWSFAAAHEEDPADGMLHALTLCSLLLNSSSCSGQGLTAQKMPSSLLASKSRSWWIPL